MQISTLGIFESAFLALLLISATPTSSKVLGAQCSNAFTWTTGQGRVLLNGNPFHIKGTSWFGFETGLHIPHGLWAQPLSFFVNFLAANKFNALRLPFSVDLIFNNPMITSQGINCEINSNICGKHALDVMELVIDEMGKQGILVMLDQHRLNENEISQLWYDSSHPESKILQSWDILLSRFGSKWNVFALDLKNEPHGVASWGKNQYSTDWNKAAERIILHIGSNSQQFKGLFFVEGVQSNAQTPTPNSFACFWGENLEGVHDHPVDTGDTNLNSRIVYSPHVYGPGVANQDYFNSPSFPSNMKTVWDLQFGYVKSQSGHPIVIGEWGSFDKAGTKGRVWTEALASYMHSMCISDNFWWDLNPNSGDTGGLLENDWKTPVQYKLDLLSGVQPNPSKLTMSGNQYCIQSGSGPSGC